MPLVTLTEAAFEAFASTVKERYFEQSTNMNTLLKKRGYTTELKGFEDKQGKLQVAALIFSTPVAGGIHMEIHYGPLFLDESYLVPFLKELKKDAKANKVIEFVVKPYAHYQVFDDHGSPQTTVDQDHIDLLTHIGFEHTKPKVGYTSHDWHYVKDLTGITEKTLINSFSKKENH